MSQGHNALPRPGLEPRSSDSEPSALTTGLLDKACPRYSWPLMLEVAPCTVVWLYGCTSKFFQLDGLLLFCIIMGLCELCYELNFLAHISQSLWVKFAWLHGRKFKVVCLSPQGCVPISTDLGLGYFLNAMNSLDHLILGSSKKRHMPCGV